MAERDDNEDGLLDDPRVATAQRVLAYVDSFSILAKQIGLASGGADHEPALEAIVTNGLRLMDALVSAALKDLQGIEPKSLEGIKMGFRAH